MCIYIYIYIYRRLTPRADGRTAPDAHVASRFNARKRKAKPLRASRSLSENFPCTGYKAFSLKGKALRGNRVARVRT